MSPARSRGELFHTSPRGGVPCIAGLGASLSPAHSTQWSPAATHQLRPASEVRGPRPGRRTSPAHLSIRRTWKFSTGCCLNPKKMCPKGYRCQGMQVFLQLTLNSLIVPAMWICIALLHGSFYACAMSGWENPEYVQNLCSNKSEQCQAQLFKVTCGKAAMSANEMQEVTLILQAQSQVLGWCLIAVLASISLLWTCWSSCNSKVSSIQMSFWRIYIEKEKEKFDQLAQEYANKLAERNLRSFFENKEPTEFALPNNKAWEKISTLYTFNPDHQYYSTLHKFVEHGDSDISGKEVMMDFVDAQV